MVRVKTTAIGLADGLQKYSKPDGNTIISLYGKRNITTYSCLTSHYQICVHITVTSLSRNWLSKSESSRSCRNVIKIMIPMKSVKTPNSLKESVYILVKCILKLTLQRHSCRCGGCIYHGVYGRYCISAACVVIQWETEIFISVMATRTRKDSTMNRLQCRERNAARLALARLC